MHLNDPLRDGQSQAGTALLAGDGIIGLLELLKQLGLIGSGDARASIANRYIECAIVGGLCTNSGSLAIFAANPSLTEKPEDPLSNVDPPASMSRNEMESSWGKCEADMIRGPLATRRLSLSSYFESSQSPRLTGA